MAKGKDEFLGYIQWALQALKREDRIVWFLRLLRIDQYAEVQQDIIDARTGPYPVDEEELGDMADRLIPVFDKDARAAGFRDSGEWVSKRGPMPLAGVWMARLQHYMGLPSPAIQECPFL